MTEKKKLGLALCGSYCTYDKVFAAAEKLRAKYDLVPLMSETAAGTDTRFGAASMNLLRLTELTGKEVITTIAGAEPLGPARPLDALVIAPCTGNTLAKLAHGMTDSAVTMAAKAHLRNGKPLVIAFSTNDPAKKPRSLQSDFELIGDTVEAALRGWQLQPILRK